MIHSSLFSNDDSSVWDPKASGQFLRISDDQLQILNNLPEWSKVITKDSTNLGITKESSILISQTSEVESQISGIRNQNIHQYTKNIELFDENEQCRKTILKTLELNTKKRNKSSSLIEISKHNKDLPSLSALKRISSTSDIHIQNFHPKEIFLNFNVADKQPLNITYPVSTASQNRSKDIFSNTIEVDSLKPLNENLGIPDIESNKTKSCNLKQSCEDMEIIAQQPININALKANVSDGESFELTQEKQDKLSTYAEPEKLSNLQSDNPISNGSENEENSNNGSGNKENSNHVSVSDSNNKEERSTIMEEKQALLSINAECKEPSSLHSKKEVISDEHENYKEQTGQVSSANSEQDVEAFAEMKSDSAIKPPVFENNAFNGNQENLNAGKIEKSEIAKDISEDIPRQQGLPEKSSCDVVNIQYSSKSPQAIDVSNISPDKLPTAETPVTVSNTSPDKLPTAETSVTFKRKAESKKYSKKRKYLQEKKREPDVRSLKKTGDITYSFEDIEILLDLIKQFL